MKTIDLNRWLFNPFHYIAGMQALITGWLIILITAVIAFYGRIHFDGAIDLHVGAVTPFWFYLAEPFVAWASIVIVFYPTALLLSNSKIRLIDFMGTTALARVAMLPGALVALLPPIQNLNPEKLDPTGLIASLLLLVPAIWLVALLYNAFSMSGNLRGGKAVAGFIAALLIAEIISKFALYQFINYLK